MKFSILPSLFFAFFFLLLGESEGAGRLVPITGVFSAEGVDSDAGAGAGVSAEVVEGVGSGAASSSGTPRNGVPSFY